MEQTTALRKIASLKKRIWGIQGGQGAGKTYSILQLIINHASSNPNKEIFIASSELSKMRITVIKDFIKIMRSFGIFNKSNFTDGTLYRFPNNSFIKFIGLDKEDIGKGLRSDIIFVNEANKVDFDTYRELTSRAKRVIIDFNPNKLFWFHSEIKTREDCDYLKLTFQDNECLSQEERNEILLYYKLGYDDQGDEINAYWANMWRVYGCGEIGIQTGAIFQNWKLGDFNDTLHFGYGLDFGSDDPDAMVKVAIDNKNKKIYLKEEIYKSGNSTADLITLIKSTYQKNALIIADSAGKRTIDDIRRHGINIKAVEKPKIVDSIKLLQGYELIVSHESKHLINELISYIWLEKKSGTPIDKDNHAIDAFRYYCSNVLNPKSYSKGVISARMT